jgi:hypothetical protein
MASIPGTRSGVVKETMNSGGYTYVLVETAEETFWAAAPEFTVSVGATVSVPEGMPMQNYHSSTLDRDFELLYFVQEVFKGGVDSVPSATGSGDQLSLPPRHPEPVAASDAGFDYDKLSPADGGLTVSEIFARTAELGEKEVILRGIVVKYNAGILGSNWLHVRDGTGAEGTNDLTVTTEAEANVGDTVLIKGTLGIDRDIGSGYFFPVILENAEVTVE